MPGSPFDRDNGPQPGRPRPRPGGFSPQRPDFRGNRPAGPYRSDSRGSRSGPDARRPAPRRRGPVGPARIEPLQPKSGKQRRRMAKAAAWRLAQLLHVRPSVVMTSEDLQSLLEDALPRLVEDGCRGQAARLAAKVERLQGA